MRATILMCLFIICAALSLHYVQLASSAHAANARSDPLVAFDQAFRMSSVDGPTTCPDATLTSTSEFDN